MSGTVYPNSASQQHDVTANVHRCAYCDNLDCYNAARTKPQTPLKMLFACVLMALVGLLISVKIGPGRGNPFTAFFCVWSAVTVGAFLAEDTFLTISEDFWAMLGAFLSIYLGCALYSSLRARVLPVESHISTISYRDKFVDIGQIVSVIALPIIYLKASEIAEMSVFSPAGYMALRAAFIAEVAASYGPIGYIVPVSFVIASIRLTQFLDKQTNKKNLAIAIAVALCMAYLTTGRTFFMMLFCFLLFPLIFRGKIKLGGVVIAGVVLAASFVMIALLTQRGVSATASVDDNVDGIIKTLRVYFLSPIFAMGSVFDGNGSATYGDYTFRFFYMLANVIGLNIEIPPLIRDYVLIPDMTNVFTVMDPYYRDFGVGGVLIFAALSGLAHDALYEKAKSEGGPYIFIHAAFMFPLVMQFFQDMYMSLLSTWIQVVFWYMLFVRVNSGKKNQQEIPQNV
ncbi:O-antigen polymerase [Cupriavidus metallidurans]|nr:O-antigen polymerase [Cupriavidus metallidurans]QGS29973.1 oligosaccharide repeat unit polymerase [Cupriavidus metallidurans]